MEKEHDTFTDSSESEIRSADLGQEETKFTDSPGSEVQSDEAGQEETKEPLEIMDYEDLKKMAGLEDIEELNIKIINLERKIEILIERSGRHHDLRHVVLHWIAGATAGAAVFSFESIREVMLSSGLHIPDALLKILEALASGITL